MADRTGAKRFRRTNAARLIFGQLQAAAPQEPPACENRATEIGLRGLQERTPIRLECWTQSALCIGYKLIGVEDFLRRMARRMFDRASERVWLEAIAGAKDEDEIIVIGAYRHFSRFMQMPLRVDLSSQRLQACIPSRLPEDNDVDMRPFRPIAAGCVDASEIEPACARVSPGFECRQRPEAERPM